MKKVGLALLKLGLPAALFVYLLWNVPADDYTAFWNQPKRWELLLAAQLITLSALVISFLRWRMLVRSFDIPFTVREALRLGFIGYLLNFVSFGSVGGDLFKAILVAQGKPEKRPESVASVLLDRALGLLGLVLLAWISLVVFADDQMSLVLIGIRRAAGIFALAFVAGLALAIFAGQWFERLLDLAHGVPLVGPTAVRMARAVRMLRARPGVLLQLCILSLMVHTMLSCSLFLISSGIYAEHPTLKEHLMVVPPGMAAGTLPLAPGGIGVQEGALAGLFKQLRNLPENYSGVLVATVYRLITITIAGVGLVFYLASHGQEFEFVGREHTQE